MSLARERGWSTGPLKQSVKNLNTGSPVWAWRRCRGSMNSLDVRRSGSQANKMLVSSCFEGFFWRYCNMKTGTTTLDKCKSFHFNVLRHWLKYNWKILKCLCLLFKVFCWNWQCASLAKALMAQCHYNTHDNYTHSFIAIRWIKGCVELSVCNHFYKFLHAVGKKTKLFTSFCSERSLFEDLKLNWGTFLRACFRKVYNNKRILV